ncbi:RNA polymerase subunit sigma-24 [Pseudoxanthomonas broegbernensis]|uniref:RNA polymerase subunit sigma-24 n=1 Tax=Pseudoxanthomonas broegbernensis TaxID=83619 RepID=A0A7V8GP57_9GAMM|nr:sigma-70 family RNA polymerase sigma factor [Pseudoxanthomonas broegbernensis]KAF1687565.1 RNA polymerase subunit sigma-24 [Pseudoxanthomonas broegbernensis]MBB6064578.1 RNA polymerase sigma-70 factor (ECF subfamily) [Pseudoxanthomonas broegbernensis]
MTHGYTGIVEIELLRDVPADAPCANDDVAQEFEAFMRDQQPCLLQFLRLRVPNDEDAHDLAQESLTRLLRYRDSEPASAWRPLLFRIARNLINEQYRRSQTRHVGDHVPLEGVELPDPAPAPAQHQQDEWLRAAILELPPRCRQVYVLRRVDGLSHAQIARRCGISVKTVEKHLTKALAILCERAGVWASDASS